jgi:hypothetical protein
MTKRLSGPADVVPAGADDIKRIRGIGPGIAQRLHAAGILTFAQLAGQSPAELAAIVGDVAGLSIDQIVKKDWAGQARELARERLSAVPEDAPAPAVAAPHDAAATPESRQHYATFTLELLLDEENDVRRTRATHVQVGVEEAWAGWRPARLMDFFMRYAAIQTQPIEVVTVPDTATAPVEAAGPTAAADLRALDVIPRNADSPRSFLRHRQPFAIGLTLDLDGAALPEGAAPAYAAMVYAKDLQRQTRGLLAEARGMLAASGPLTLCMEGAELAYGIYRLDAVVVVTLAADAAGAQADLTAFREGGLLHVY